MIFVTVFIDLLGFGIVLPLLPRYAQHFHADGLTLGLLMASFSAMQFLFAPLWGRVSDKVGRRPVLMLGLAGSTLFYALFGVATTLGAAGQWLGLGVIPWLFLCRIGAGIAGATIPTAQAYIADVTTAANRAKGMALIGAAFGVGFTFGPLLGALFVSGDVGDATTLAHPAVVEQLKITPDQSKQIAAVVQKYDAKLEEKRLTLKRKDRQQLLDARERDVLKLFTPAQTEAWLKFSAPSPWPGYAASVLSGLALLFSIFLLPESLQPGAARASGGHWLEWRGVQQALTQPALLLVLVTMFLTTCAFAQFESTLSLLTAQLGLADRYNYFVFAYIGFVLSLSQGFLVRRLVPRLGEFVMSIAGTLLMTAGLLLIGLAGVQDSVAMLYAVVPICVIGVSAVNPSLQSLLSRQTSESQQGEVLGVGQSVSALARIAGPVIGLTLSDISIIWPYWSAAGLMGLGVLMTLLLPRTTGHITAGGAVPAPAAPD